MDVVACKMICAAAAISILSFAGGMKKSKVNIDLLFMIDSKANAAAFSLTRVLRNLLKMQAGGGGEINSRRIHTLNN